MVGIFKLILFLGGFCVVAIVVVGFIFELFFGFLELGIAVMGIVLSLSIFLVVLFFYLVI